MTHVEQLNEDGGDEDLGVVVAALREKLLAVQQELAAMRVDAAAESGQDGILSRRQLLSRWGMATVVGAGLIAVPVLRSAPAASASDASDASHAKARPLLLGQTNDAGVAATTLTSGTFGATLMVANHADGDLALAVEAGTGGCSGLSVQLPDPAGNGFGINLAVSGLGSAMSALVVNRTNGATAVLVRHEGVGTAVEVTDDGFGRGRGVDVHLDSANNPSAAVTATTAGTGPAVSASAASGDAVQATSASGRGAVLAGKAAAARLVPGPGAHPSHGETGDLYVDSAGRLWFCRGGAQWKQLA